MNDSLVDSSCLVVPPLISSGFLLITTTQLETTTPEKVFEVVRPGKVLVFATKLLFWVVSQVCCFKNASSRVCHFLLQLFFSFVKERHQILYVSLLRLRLSRVNAWLNNLFYENEQLLYNLLQEVMHLDSNWGLDTLRWVLYVGSSKLDTSKHRRQETQTAKSGQNFPKWNGE